MTPLTVLAKKKKFYLCSESNNIFRLHTSQNKDTTEHSLHAALRFLFFFFIFTISKSVQFIKHYTRFTKPHTSSRSPQLFWTIKQFNETVKMFPLYGTHMIHIIWFSMNQTLCTIWNIYSLLMIQSAFQSFCQGTFYENIYQIQKTSSDRYIQNPGKFWCLISFRLFKTPTELQMKSNLALQLIMAMKQHSKRFLMSCLYLQTQVALQS